MAINKKLLHFKKFSDFNSKKLSANEANTQYTLGVGGETHDGAPDVLYQSICWIKDTQQQWTHGQLYDGSTNSVESNVYYTEFTADDVYWTYMTEGSPAPLTITQELLDAINAEKIIIVPSGLDRGSYIMQVGALDQETTRVTFIGSTDLIYCDMLNTNFILGNTINLITAGRRCSTMFEPSTTDTEGNTIVKRDSKGRIYAASYKGPTKAWNMPDATNVASDEGQLQAKLVNGTTIKKINNRNILGSGNITVQDTLVSGKNIKTVNGQSILGSGNLNTDNRVVLEFSICDLNDLIAGNRSAISIDPQSLETNIILNVPMIIPFSEEEDYRGYYTVTGYMEDLVYLTIVAGTSVYYIEHGIGNYDITAQEVHRYAISEMQDLIQNIDVDLANLYDTKQDLLISGNNIKTINGQSILGDGDISNLAEKPYVDEVLQSRVFVGTQEEYDTAYAEGKIAMGALVIILDGSETEEGGATISALLGTAILGQMLLGQK